jgi:predicted Holliday junction resolvase-like endonuclease
MDPLLYLSMIIIALVLVLVIVVRAYHDKVATLKERLAAVETSKRSLSTTYGLISEQWAPFMSGYPYDPRNFRFIGKPIDGVQFENDKVVFVEFKVNTSQLSEEQRRIRTLIEQGRVEWYEFRMEKREGTSVAAPPKPTLESYDAPRSETSSSW